jgi:hypothetical protein
MKGLSSFSRAGTFALWLQHSTERKSPQEGPYYQVSGYTVLKHRGVARSHFTSKAFKLSLGLDSIPQVHILATDLCMWRAHIRAPWSESLSLNNEVNNCPFVRPSIHPSVSFVPLQIIMRSLFRLIICTFCYDISFKCWIFQNPMVFPPWFIGFYGVPTYVKWRI